MIIAENYADIRIQKYDKPFGSRYNGTDYNSTFTLDVPLPKDFSWNIITDKDNNSIKLIKERTLNSVNQGKCGNCYAFALASVLSDLFVIKYGLQENPDLSASYMNVHYTELNGCGGGNPVEALKYLFKDGVVSKRCLDNSVCLTNSKCNGQDADNTPSSELNKLYRAIGEGCYKNVKKEHKLYFPEKGSDKEVYFKVYPNYDQTLADEILKGAKSSKDFVENTQEGITSYPGAWPILKESQEEARKQIYRNGPGVGMCLILNNLMQPFYKNKDFEDTFDGLFFDSIVWNSDGSFEYQNPQLINCGISQPNNYKLSFDGGHAFAVIGFGVSEKEIPMMDFKTNKIVKVKNIPFWWIRNSWGEEWNPKYKGCFKLPMYPFNKVTQIDIPLGEYLINNQPVTVPVPYVGKREGMGGILFIEAGNLVDYKNYESNMYYKNNPDFSSSASYLEYKDPYYYTTSSQKYIIKGGVLRDSKGCFVNENKHKSLKFYYLFFICICILVLGLVYYYRKSIFLHLHRRDKRRHRIRK